MKIDPIEQGTRKTRLIGLGAPLWLAATAGISGLQRMAAAAGIHRRHQLEARRIDAAMIGPGNRDLARFQRLAQRVERLGLEFRQFIEEQHAIMGERNLAGPRAGTAADKGRHRGRMMRRAKRPPVGQFAARQRAGDGMDHRDFEQFAGRQRRQDRRQSCRQHAFSGARADR